MITVYAIFVCTQMAGCVLGGDPDYYDTLAACRENVLLLTKLANEHRVDSSSEKLWFECRSKRVETWEATEP